MRLLGVLFALGLAGCAPEPQPLAWQLSYEVGGVRQKQLGTYCWVSTRSGTATLYVAGQVVIEVSGYTAPICERLK